MISKSSLSQAFKDSIVWVGEMGEPEFDHPRSAILARIAQKLNLKIHCQLDVKSAILLYFQEYIAY